MFIRRGKPNTSGLSVFFYNIALFFQMLSKGHKKYLKNPTLGLVPYIAFIVGYQICFNITHSLLIGLSIAVILEIILKYYAKSKISGLTIGISTLALALTLATRLFAKENTTEMAGIYIIISEIYLVCIIMVVRILEPKIMNSYFWNKNYTQKPFLSDFFQTAFFSQYIFTLHLFYMVIYIYFRGSSLPYTIIDNISYLWIPIVGSLFIIFYENYRIRRISKKLQKEQWLPIVNEKGEVSGKIAKSESDKLKNRFMHPVIRIALIHKDQIYLQYRPKDDTLDTGLLDHPFEKHLLFNNEINIAARDSIADIMEASQNSNFKFLIKYVFKNDETNRLIFLYTLRIESEDQIRNFPQLKGKFWTSKQIEINLTKDNIFSECFQLEFEYLKNTIIMAEKIKNAVKNA